MLGIRETEAAPLEKIKEGYNHVGDLMSVKIGAGGFIFVKVICLGNEAEARIRANRLVARYNALSGIADPAEFVEAAKKLADYHNVLGKGEFVDTLQNLYRAWKGGSVESAIAEIVKDVPDEEFEKLPEDGAAELDHHLYGTPKKGE